MIIMNIKYNVQDDVVHSLKIPPIPLFTKGEFPPLTKEG